MSGILSHHGELNRTLWSWVDGAGFSQGPLHRMEPYPASKVEKPHTNQGHLGPPFGHSPAPSFPYPAWVLQAARVGLGMKGVALREGFLGLSQMFNAPSSPPQREEPSSVINHLPERDSPVHACPAAERPRLGVPTVKRGQTEKEAETPNSDRQIHTATLKTLILVSTILGMESPKESRLSSFLPLGNRFRGQNSLKNGVRVSSHSCLSKAHP